ncbi:TRAP transporter small permease subunit [Nocardiopsis suaedae]|uniref:TRAP transporter small permease n=1 Tax=Nocardiopsis suaedae TaxID=3018444 RepID=A0ABT4TWS6_9ACTN|nr:TRAP transporter small permease [Nocardiopsis suaedae]MDA2808670.1 TRAP transporter small permease [Nocardiopsis suaedae]
MRRPHLPRAATAAATAFDITAGMLLLALMLLTVADVAGRNLRGQSVLGTVDISTLLLVAIAYLGLASAEISGQHVSVGLVELRLGRGARTALSALRLVLLAALGALLVWGLGEVLLSAVDRGETTNDILRLATWPAKLVLLASFLLFFAAAVAKEAQKLRTLRSGGDAGPDGEASERPGDGGRR